MASVTPREAAEILGVSLSTIKRRLRIGELSGHKESGDHGETWIVDLPDKEEKGMTEHQEINPEDTEGVEPPGLEENSDEPTSEEEIFPEEEVTFFVNVESGVVSEREIEREPLTCAICSQSIGIDDDYVDAAYGPVHTEPCSHQTRSIVR